MNIFSAVQNYRRAVEHHSRLCHLGCVAEACGRRRLILWVEEAASAFHEVGKEGGEVVVEALKQLGIDDEGLVVDEEEVGHGLAFVVHEDEGEGVEDAHAFYLGTHAAYGVAQDGGGIVEDVFLGGGEPLVDDDARDLVHVVVEGQEFAAVGLHLEVDVGEEGLAGDRVVGNHLVEAALYLLDGGWGGCHGTCGRRGLWWQGVRRWKSCERRGQS